MARSRSPRTSSNEETCADCRRISYASSGTCAGHPVSPSPPGAVPNGMGPRQARAACMVRCTITRGTVSKAYDDEHHQVQSEEDHSYDPWARAKPGGSARLVSTTSSLTWF